MADSGQRESRTRFAHSSVLADAACAAQLRQEFSVWLKRYFALDPTKVSDVVLAVNEALANAAEFAYSATPQPGLMSLLADYDCAAAVLTVTVSDEGHWRRSTPETTHVSRGRGIPLMEALADEATFDSTGTGTRVSLVWNEIAAEQSAAS
jgi:serine/threonine-protein kinase RsbW